MKEELNILFGNETEAKDNLEKLKQELDYNTLPESHKGTLTDKQKEIDEVTKNETIIKEELHITENTNIEEISSHNSNRILEEKEITKNTKELKEDPEGTISSHNFENEILN